MARADGRPVGGLVALRQTHAVEIHRLAPDRPDMNVVALAVVVIGHER